MLRREATVTTTNKPLEREISCSLEVEVPENLQEASDFFDGEAKLLEVIQGEVVRRRVNAARAVIRDVENPDTDFAALAQSVADAYTPGRKGGFQAPSISQDELAEAAGDMDALMALLQSRGAQITV